MPFLRPLVPRSLQLGVSRYGVVVLMERVPRSQNRDLGHPDCSAGGAGYGYFNGRGPREALLLSVVQVRVLPPEETSVSNARVRFFPGGFLNFF